jgi:hypothetical protein
LNGAFLEMHNCREVKAQLNELVLNNEVLPAELSACNECRAEFEALNATLRMTKRLYETAAPSEDYWTSYHAQLRQRLTFAARNGSEQSPAEAQPSKEDLLSSFAPLIAPLQRLVKTTILVPVPLAVALIIICCALGVFAFRSRQPQSVQPQSPIIVHVPVEVPVVREKTVTQVVYRDRQPRLRSSKQPRDGPSAETTFARSQKPPGENIPSSLTGFKPTEEIKLTVIKGGFPNEK